MGAFHKAGFTYRQKEYELKCPYSFSHALPARYSVLHLLDVLSGGNEPPLCKGSLFYVHLCRVNFLDKHCFCGHKSEAPAGRFLFYITFILLTKLLID